MQAALIWSLAGCLLVEHEEVFDPDGDGVDWPADCDSARSDVFPGAEDVWYDGVDQDCDGASDYDQDGDGADSAAHGGADCDDLDSEISPDADEICSDQIDQDCDGGAGDCAVPSGDVEVARSTWLSAYFDGEELGRGLSVGDLDGDGALDLVATAPEAERPGARGALYAVYGPLTASDGSLVPEVYALGGPDGIGASVSGGADLDGDGFNDVLLSSLLGEAWLFYAPLGDDLSSPDVVYSGAVEDAYGEVVLLMGDATGDGLPEVVLGAPDGAMPGQVAIFSGAPGTSGVDWGAAAGVIEGDRGGDLTGAALAPIGDRDGDGIEDLLVGAPASDTNEPDTGKVYLVHGPLTGTIVLDDLLGMPTSPRSGSAVGAAVAGVGDLNGDGRPDFVAGAPGYGDGGGAFVFYDLVTTVDQASAQLLGPPGSELGAAVSGAGDVNIDGFRDLLIGAPSGSGGGAGLLYGPVSGVLLSSDADVWLEGGEDGDGLGASLWGGADLSGDGFDDVLVAAPGVHGEAGAISVIFGVGM